jgi:hypothetical protein
MMIFAEGSTSNNTHICPFKRGAFQSLVAIKPLSITYRCPTIHVSNEIITDPILIIFFACNLLPSIAEVTHYPLFEPNEYLWETHANKGQQKWEIYAWALRDMILKDTGL